MNVIHKHTTIFLDAFARNAASERAAATIVVESEGRASIAANTFFNLRPESVMVPATEAAVAALAHDNWFVNEARARGRR